MLKPYEFFAVQRIPKDKSVPMLLMNGKSPALFWKRGRAFEFMQQSRPRFAATNLLRIVKVTVAVKPRNRKTAIGSGHAQSTV